jgi:hypothetical protein
LVFVPAMYMMAHKMKIGLARHRSNRAYRKALKLGR